jgi:hypothetical protein
VKVFIFSFLFIWVRASFPRFRFDILMLFCWKSILPLVLCCFIFFIIFSFFYSKYSLLRIMALGALGFFFDIIIFRILFFSNYCLCELFFKQGFSLVFFFDLLTNI